MEMASFDLKEVTTSSEIKQWLHLDRKIYKDCPYWVCPLDDDIERIFNPERNHLFEGGEAIRWIVQHRKL